MPILPDITTTGTATTTADLIERTRQIVGEQSADFFSDAEITDALNEGILKIFSKVFAVVRDYSANTVIGDAVLHGCDDVVRWLSVKVGGTELLYTDKAEFALLEDASGPPTSYCPDFLDSAGMRVLVVYPTPTAVAAAVGTYWAVPATLTSEQGPSWHRQYHFLPCFHAASVILDKDNLSEEAENNRGRFEGGILDYRDFIGRTIPKRDSALGVTQKGEM